MSPGPWSHQTPVPDLKAWIPPVIAAVTAFVPAFIWVWSSGGQLLTWHGLALLTGFGAVGLFGVSMLLMLRLKWLDRSFGGLGRLYRVHHAFGTSAFLLLLVHPLALALGAMQTQPSAALGLLWPDPSSAVVVSGWAALLLFIAFFVVTVAPGLSFDLWRRMHRASVFAYAAMAWHLLAVSSASLAAGLGLGLMAAGALGYAHRLLVQDPLRRSLRYRIAEARRRGPNVIDLVLEPIGEPLRFDAGQFAYVALQDSLDYRTCGEVHPYTMTGHPDDPRLHLSIKALGDCTRHIQEVSPGAQALVQGPFGGIFPAGARQRPQVWVGGGIGITPFLSRARTVGGGDPPIDIVYAAANEAAALYLQDLRALAAERPSMRVHTIFEESDGLPSAEAIESRVGSLEGRDCMLAGPPAMVRFLRRELRLRGVPASRIHSEEGVLR